MLLKILLTLPVIALATACNPYQPKTNSSRVSSADPVAVQSVIPAERLNTLKAALPKVAYPKLQSILDSQQTFWYDHESMAPTYQASILESPPWGANSNDRWFDLIAASVQPTALNFYDTQKKRWRFPFGTTAGADQSTNIKVANFLWLPDKDGKLLPVATYMKPSPIQGYGFQNNSWGWLYPIGAMVGEVIFVKDGNAILPTEIRTRTRQASGWAVNSFRPFPTATALSQAIKTKRPEWENNNNLKSLVSHLENSSTLTAKSLKASQLPGVFEEDGALDILPDFGDHELVRDLLTKTTFVSAYNTAWKANGNKVTYAASTTTGLSIVPDHYEAGVMAVNEQSCMRCHKETGRNLPTFSPQYSDIVLYGEVWGRDGIFSFHPFDESLYQVFWNTSRQDNRSANPRLKSQGIIAELNGSVHKAPYYPAKEAIGANANVGSGANPPPISAGNNGSATNNGGDNKTFVEFHIPAGTGKGDWNSESMPATVRAGQTLRIINDDDTKHVLHTGGQPCPHGDTTPGREIKKGQYYDCAIPSGSNRMTHLLWDHNLGSPNSGRFWLRVD